MSHLRYPELVEIGDWFGPLMESLRAEEKRVRCETSLTPQDSSTNLECIGATAPPPCHIWHSKLHSPLRYLQVLSCGSVPYNCSTNFALR